MTLDAALLNALQAVQQGIVRVINDLEARPDYSKTPEFAVDVKLFSKFSQDLLTAEAETDLTEKSKTTLLEDSAEVQPILQKLVNDNIAMSQMGQLSMERTISPTMALANNVNLNAEQAATQSLVAELNSTATASEGEWEGVTALPVATLPETEVVSRFNRWAMSMGGVDVDAL